MRWLIAVVVVLLSGQSAFALTRAELRYRAALRLAEDTTTSASKQWSTDALNTWINDAIWDISAMALCHVKETTFALVVQKADYTMSADYIRTLSVKIGSKGATYDLDHSYLGLKATAGADLGKQTVVRLTPTQWEELGEKLRTVRFSPTPAIADTVKLTYAVYSRQLTSDTMECLLPAAFQRCIPDYVASQAWGNTRSGDPYWPRFMERMQLLVPTIQMGSDPEVPEAKPGGNP